MKKTSLFRVIIIIASVFILNACASGARMNAMIVSATPDTMINEQNTLYQAVEIVEVSGGQKTNPLWTSEVGDVEFEQALLNTLKAHAMFSIDEAKYKLTAELVEVKQPLFGLSLTVKSTVKYELMDVKSQKIIFDEVINNEYTAAFGDSFMAVKRLQLANEGAIRENISSFITDLITRSKSGKLDSNTP